MRLALNYLGVCLRFSGRECNLSLDLFDFVLFPQIWWTALSVALGLEVRGEVIKGTPCVKRFNQLYCPSAGNSYPM